ncbi:MAG: hypothetical protein ACK56I_06930 [bacterium]
MSAIEVCVCEYVVQVLMHALFIILHLSLKDARLCSCLCLYVCGCLCTGSMCAEESAIFSHHSFATETGAPDPRLSDLLVVGKHRGNPHPLTITPSRTPATLAHGMGLQGLGEEQGGAGGYSIAGAGPKSQAPVGGESVHAGRGGEETGGDMANKKSTLHHLDAVKRLNAMLLQLDRKDRDVLKLRASQLGQ